MVTEKRNFELHTSSTKPRLVFTIVVNREAIIRSVNVSTGQSKLFSIKDGDNRIGILAANHQADDCAGKIFYAVTPPNDKDSGIQTIQKKEYK